MSSQTHLLSLGTPCSYPHCSLIDFLPFKCPHCPDSSAFCAEHFHPHCTTAHVNLDRVAPSCPLCGDPVAIPPSENPNLRMETHISRFREVMNPNGPQKGKSGSKICSRGKCGKVLFAPIGCDKCHAEFCPQHRFPKDHSCPSLTSQPSIFTSTLKPFIRPSPISTTSSSSSPNSAHVSSKSVSPLPESTQSSSPKLSIPVSVPRVFFKTDRVSPPPVVSPPSAFVCAAVLRSTPSSSTKPSSSIISINPMTRTHSKSAKPLDPMSRAKEERESRRKAMTERAKKGLLTQEEKFILAQEEAARAQGGIKANKECIIM